MNAKNKAETIFEKNYAFNVFYKSFFFSSYKV